MSPRARRFLLAALLLVAAGVAWRLSRPGRPPRPAPRDEGVEPAIVRTTPVVRTTDEGAAVLGINEGISLPGMAGQRLFAGNATLSRRVAMVKSLGTRLVRANSHAWPHLAYSTWTGSFAEADRFMRTVGEAGIDVVLVIGPWPGTRTALYTERYVPEDMAGYEAWVEALVERYDGDGADDMPGLVRPVLAWEVDNEPDQHHLVAPRRGERGAGTGLGSLLGGDAAGEGGADEDPVDDLDAEADAGEEDGGAGDGGGGAGDGGGAAGGRGGGRGRGAKRTPFETPREYAEVLIATSRAIRRADPDARVLSGGIYRAAMPAGRRYLAAVLAVPGAREAIDGLSLHCYFGSDNLSAVQRTMRTARALAPELPVWITETSVPSEGEQGWIDDEWQARMVAGIVGGFLADGADRIFWHSLVDAPNERQGPVGYATNSLFRGFPDGGLVRYEPKPAGEVFRRLAGHLAGQDPASFAEVPAEGGRLLETDGGWLAFDGEPVVPAGGHTVEDLVTGEVVVGAERAPAPAWIGR